MVEFDEVKSVEKIFSGCPVLEELVLEDCCWTNIKNVTLSIPSLRELTIYSCGDELFNCTIKICAVNLISIDFSNDMVVELVPHDLSSLVYASIDVDFNLDEERSQRAVKLLNGIQNVKSLSISYFSLMSFTGSPLVQEQLPAFDTLTHLTLKCESSADGIGYSGALMLMQLLQKAPNLESLDIDDGIDSDPEQYWEMEVLPHCVKSCLETFSLSYFKWGAAEIDFLKYLYKNATALERVSLFCSENSSDQDVKKQEIIHQLNMLRNGSGLTKCALEFFVDAQRPAFF